MYRLETFVLLSFFIDIFVLLSFFIDIFVIPIFIFNLVVCCDLSTIANAWVIKRATAMFQLLVLIVEFETKALCFSLRYPFGLLNIVLNTYVVSIKAIYITAEISN